MLARKLDSVVLGRTFSMPVHLYLAPWLAFQTRDMFLYPVRGPIVRASRRIHIIPSAFFI